jgi:hypothetical protein
MELLQCSIIAKKIATDDLVARQDRMRYGPLPPSANQT